MTHIELLVLSAAGVLAMMGLALANIRLALTITMSLAAFTITWNDVRLGVLTLSDLLLLGTVGLVVVSPSPARKLFAESQRSLIVYALLLFFGGLVGAVLRRQTDVGWDIGFRFVASVAVIVFLVSALVRRQEDFERYALWYVLGAAVNGAIAISGGDDIAGRPIGLTNHPNHLGLAMMLALFLAIAVLGSQDKLVSRTSAVCVLPIVAAVVSSGSRGALLASSVGLLALLLMRRGRAVPWLAALAFATVVLTVSLPQALRSDTSGFGRLISPSDGELASGAERLSYYREASELIQTSPVFGEGFSQALVFHSVPLQVLVVGGLVGLAALLVLFRGGLLAIRYSVTPGRPILARACGAGLVATAAFLMVANAMFDRYYLFFVSMAFLACSSELSPTIVPSAHGPGKAGGRADHLV